MSSRSKSDAELGNTKADVVSMRLSDGDRLDIECISLDVIYTPGHTDDSYSFALPDRVFTGDTLLIRGTGRNNFQNGDPRAQYDSIFNRLLKMPNETLVFPGHDYKGDTVSTIGEERRSNPRLQLKPVVLIALVAGLIFGAGLAISDMVNPARVLNFFDIAGNWDPTLILVMVGALIITAIGCRLIFARDKPLFGAAFNLPTTRRIDVPLIGGAAVFGIGWGLAGFCPGPALAALVSLQPKVLIFLLSLVVGMVAAKFWQNRQSAVKAG